MAAQNNTVISLDVGERRIGVALASLVARLPAPHGVIASGDTAIEAICDLAAKQQVQVIVVGLPRGLNGQDTAQTQQVRDFTDKLRKVCKLPIHFQDEALTSKQAEQELSDRVVRYTKEAVDALAATYILTDFLQEHPELKE